MPKGTARIRKDHTLAPESIIYLKQFDNQSRIIDEAIELHRNKDKILNGPIDLEIKNWRVKL